MKTRLFILSSVLCLLISVSGCAHHQSPLTIAPHSVVSTSASFDQNDRNSGLISSDATGFLVTQHFVERHQVNTTDSGVKAEGAHYRITAQVMARCIEFDRLRKNAQK